MINAAGFSWSRASPTRPDCWVLVDVNALYLVLDHLLDTELRDRPEGVPIRVAIDADLRSCRITMSGHGLMALVERTSQGRSTYRNDLGLSLMRQLVEAWKGDVTCS